EPLRHHRLARELVGDDLGVRVRGGVHFVAVPVVPVEVCVHDVTHGLRRDVAQSLHDHASRRGLGVRVDDDHAVVTFDDRRVGVHLVGRGGHGDVHDIGNLMDFEASVPSSYPLWTYD